MNISKRKRTPQREKQTCITSEKLVNLEIRMDDIRKKLSEIGKEIQEIAKEAPALIRECRRKRGLKEE